MREDCVSAFRTASRLAPTPLCGGPRRPLAPAASMHRPHHARGLRVGLPHCSPLPSTPLRGGPSPAARPRGLLGLPASSARTACRPSALHRDWLRPHFVGALVARSQCYIALNRWAKVRDTV